jgi:hypothetical protein
MTVSDLITALKDWRGDMPVVVAVRVGNDVEWRSVASVEWADTDAGPMIVLHKSDSKGE